MGRGVVRGVRAGKVKNDKRTNYPERGKSRHHKTFVREKNLGKKGKKVGKVSVIKWKLVQKKIGGS